MPYIKQVDRIKFDSVIKSFFTDNINSEGELNYVITSICKEYLRWEGKRYTTLNTIIGVLECAKHELYRRIVGPYEDTKIKENGDVY